MAGDLQESPKVVSLLYRHFREFVTFLEIRVGLREEPNNNFAFLCEKPVHRTVNVGIFPRHDSEGEIERNLFDSHSAKNYSETGCSISPSKRMRSRSFV